MTLLAFIFVVVIIAILLILAVDYLAGAAGGEPKLYLILKAVIVLGAALLVAQKAGVM